MATYHCSVKKGKTGNALTHMEYILREGKYSQAKCKEDLVFKQYGNLPQWAGSPQEFWQMADKKERTNGNVYYEFEVALPNELSLEENIKIVEAMVENHIGHSKTYTFAIHEKPAAFDNNQAQTHAHIMFSERINDGINRPANKYFGRANPLNPIRGGAKKDSRFTENFEIGSETITNIRKSCESYINAAYARNGLNITVSADSLVKQRKTALKENDLVKAKELDRVAEKHLGPKLSQQALQEAKNLNKNKNEHYFLGFASEKVRNAFIAKIIRESKQELSKIEQEIKLLESKTSNLNSDVKIIEQAVNNRVISTREYGNQYLGVVNAHISKMRHFINEQSGEMRKLQRRIIPKNRLKIIAQSVYTKGLSKHIMKEYNTLLKERKVLNDQVRSLNLTETDRRRLIQADRMLQIREIANKKQIDFLQEKLNLPIAKQRIDKMVNTLERQNLNRQVKIDRIKANVELIQQSIMRLDRLRDTLKSEIIHEQNAHMLNTVIKEANELVKNCLEKEESLKAAAAQRPKNQVDIHLHGQQFKQIINKHIADIRAKIKSNEAKTRNIKRLIMTENKVLQIAQSVYSNGKSKRLLREYNNILQERSALNKQIAIFTSQEKPGLWNFAAYKEYQSTKALLDQKDNELKARENRNKTAIKYLNLQLSTPLARENIERIVNALKLRNEIRREREAVLLNNTVKLQGYLDKFEGIRSSFTADMCNLNITTRLHSDFQTKPTGIEQAVNQCSKIVNEFQRAAIQAQIGRVKGYIKAKLPKERGKENDIDQEKEY